MKDNIVCKKCNTAMYGRGSSNPNIAIRVYVCPKCQTIVYVDRDGDEKWEIK